MKNIMTIDQGTSGGMAWIGDDDVVRAAPMPDGMTAQIDFIKDLVFEYKIKRAAIEKVGFHRVGNSAMASAKFARHCGHTEATLYLLGVSTEQITPSVWMRAMGIPKMDDVRDRKRFIRDAMQRKFPNIKVTLNVSDALALLVYVLEQR